MGERGPLRIVLADGENEQRFSQIARALMGLGHFTVQRPLAAKAIADVSLAERIDVALIIVQEDTAPTLKLIERVVREAACPVIAVLAVQNPAFVKKAARLGIFAYITDGEDPDELESSIDIVLQRFAQYHNLEGAFRRRAVTERAKGVLMERHGIDEHEAFERLRSQARRTRAKIVDVAEAIITSHTLLPRAAGTEPQSAEE